MAANEDSDLDDSVGLKTPLSLVPEPPPSPVIRSRPSFITNHEYVPSLMTFATFFCFTLFVQWLTINCPSIGFVAAVLLLALLAEWERRARYSFGRIRMRAHFDPLNLVKLPTPQFRSDIEMEPPTPWIPQEAIRSDPEDVLKRAKDTIGGQVESGGQSSLELAMIKLLREAAAKPKSDGKEKSTPENKESAPGEKAPPATEDPGAPL